MRKLRRRPISFLYIIGGLILISAYVTLYSEMQTRVGVENGDGFVRGAEPTATAMDMMSQPHVRQQEVNSTTPAQQESLSRIPISSPVLSSSYTPSSQKVFLVWSGKPTLPPMYDLGLQTAIKAFGKENIIVVSKDLVPVEGYPPIWDISVHDLAAKLTDIHPFHVWENFFREIKEPAHFADFQRIALVYLYGGLYADIDSLWLRPPPFHFPVEDGEWKGKTLLRVPQEDQATSNGVLGGIKKSIYFRQVLESMPFAFDSDKWIGIGGTLLDESYGKCTRDDFVEITKQQMYGIQWFQARESYFNQPLTNSDEDIQVRDFVLSSAHQLHLFGHVTQGGLPADGSLYDVVIKHLNMSIPEKSSSAMSRMQHV